MFDYFEFMFEVIIVHGEHFVWHMFEKKITTVYQTFELVFFFDPYFIRSIKNQRINEF